MNYSIMYRHEQPNPDSHNTMRVRIRLPMSVADDDHCASKDDTYHSQKLKQMASLQQCIWLSKSSSNKIHQV